MRADKLEEQQEEVAQGEGLHQVGPWGQVEVGGGRQLPDELDNAVDRDEEADAEDLELLIRFREVCRMPKHQDQYGGDSETCAAASDDVSELVERVAICVRLSRCCQGTFILAIALYLTRHTCNLPPTMSWNDPKLRSWVAQLSLAPALAGLLILGSRATIKDGHWGVSWDRGLGKVSQTFY